MSRVQRLLIAVLLLASALLLAGIVQSGRTLDRTVDAFQQSNDVAGLLVDARRDAAVAATALAATEPSPEELQRARDHLAFLARQLDVASLRGEQGPDRLYRLREELATGLERRGAGPVPPAERARLAAAAVELEEAIHRVSTREESVAYTERRAVLSAIGRVHALLAVVLAVAFVAAVAVTWSVRRGVRRDFERAWARLREHADELERVNVELERATATKDEFLSTVSHELRTPLTAIRGFTELMLARWDAIPDAARRRYVEVIDRQAGRQQQLVDGLLAVSTIVAGHLDPRPEPVPLGTAIAHAREATGVDVHVVGSGDAVVEVDPGHLEQVLTNLFTNVRKYGVPPIEARIEPGPDGLLDLHVSDRGPGVPEALVPTLFDRFTQGDAGDRRTSRGVGLGLAIVRDLVTANGGRVSYATGPGGTGACFTVGLPAAAPAAGRRTPAPGHSPVASPAG